ncbi:hypothetical protein DH2020_000520 [Rehmannia glutinosa]|uniref:Uncharacterized protein n=1 Tax=Rehmannia glutinosa TaxID=99300 RepID=A0ABR0XWR7_REHGL
MRRQGGQYGGDSGGGGGGDGDGGHHAYGGSSAQMHQQHHNSKSGYYQGRHQEQQSLGEKEGGQHNNQWRWERDGAQAKLPQTAMSPTPFSEGKSRLNQSSSTSSFVKQLSHDCGEEEYDEGYNSFDAEKDDGVFFQVEYDDYNGDANPIDIVAHREGSGYNEVPLLPTAGGDRTFTAIHGGREAPRSYYQNQRMDSRMPLERQGGGDPRSQSHEEDMDIGYEDNRVMHTFEGLEQRFLDDIMKLSKEQTDAEDAENARHREHLRLNQKINAINAQYEEQLFSLRTRHANRRDEFLRRESQARQQQYQQIVMEPYPTSGIGPSDPRGFNSASASEREPNRAYSSESYDPYRERNRFPGNARDHGYESKVPYPRGRAYDSGSRYY